ncbi:MAG: hypothetical protein KDI32_05880 [Pseudomonadales bacterium]|nr:hypothetical protein [Pseudomonadales bacterium]
MSAGWICDVCGAGYPVVGDVPWLLREPQDAIAEWRARLALLTRQLGDDASRADRELARLTDQSALPDRTVQRLQHLSEANRKQVALLENLLRPLVLPGVLASVQRGLGTSLPIEQGLTNYYVNLHRDWAWGGEENDATFTEVRAVLGSQAQLGRTLILGAGAGRLAYDIHEGYAPPLTVLTDYNPLLLFVAREMFAGRDLQLYEFPVAPRGLLDSAVLRRLSAPRAARGGYHIVAADALDAPFAPGSFDTVVTPWLIDVVGEPLAPFAARVNHWLKPRGRWINTGSLAFNRAPFAERLSLDETLQIVTASGFAPPDLREATIPYMRSPASRHGRLETVVSWSAIKREAATYPAARRVPQWLTNDSVPVPRTAALEFESVSSRVHAFMLALVNGERSVRDMARLIAEQRLLPADEAEAAVRRFLRRAFEASEQRDQY